MSNTIKINDTITYRPCFGMDAPKTAKVQGLMITQYPREKDGVTVNEAPISLVKENRVLFDLDDGHWCYSDQLVWFI